MLRWLVKSSVLNSTLCFSVALLAVVVVLAAMAVGHLHRTCSEHTGLSPRTKRDWASSTGGQIHLQVCRDANRLSHAKGTS